MTPGRRPRSRKAFTSARIRGVFPVPPTVRLPTTITGIPRRAEASKPTRYISLRAATASPKTRLRGYRSTDTGLSRYQWRDGKSEGVGLTASIGARSGALLRGLLHREHHLSDARPARRVHDADRRLVGGVAVAADDDDGLVQPGCGAAQLVRERVHVARLDDTALHRVLSGGADHDVHLVGALQLLVGVRGRQVDLELGLPRVSRREHQEDDDHEEHVDHRNQVDFRIVLGCACEPHGRAADWDSKRWPWTTSTSLAACCSISTTKPSTRLRK